MRNLPAFAFFARSFFSKRLNPSASIGESYFSLRSDKGCRSLLVGANVIYYSNLCKKMRQIGLDCKCSQAPQ